jgi:diguanylate cyclase (GGDEF)-like protein
MKEINDSHGHHAGDQMLPRVVHTLRSNLRLDDLIVRFGGGENPTTSARRSSSRLKRSIGLFHQILDQSAGGLTITCDVRFHSSITP